MNKLQGELLSLLEGLTDVLDSAGITYWLAFGTVLGAERHKGFIPWDDDVDIYIDGKEYPKLQNLFRDGPINNLMLHDYSTVNGYPYSFPKVIDTRTKLIEKRFQKTSYVGGIYIDIFPLFSVSNNKLLRKIDQLYRYFNYSIIESHYYDETLEKRTYIKLLSRVLKKIDAHKAQQRLYRSYIKGIEKNQNLNYVKDATQYADCLLHKTDNYLGYDIVTFENRNFKCPANHLQYLTDEYGDYQKLPPIEKRVATHSFVYLEFSDGEICH